MPTLPWLSIDTSASSSDTYIVMLTYLPLKHFYDTPRFLSYIIKVFFQLRKTNGLIGFSMRAKPFAKQYWTLSVWKDEKSIAKYIHTPPHFHIMTKMDGAMGKTAFSSWATGSTEPIEWNEALTHQNQNYHHQKQDL